jgi:hypothetical protein
MLDLILKLNFPYVKLYHTGLCIIEKCARFYDESTELLKNTFEFLANGLKIKSLSTDASRTIANICRENSQFVISNLEHFMNCR